MIRYRKNITWIVLVYMLLAACDDNVIVPAYEWKGTTTATVASLTPSKTKPVQTESISLKLEFVNQASDAVKSILLKAKVGSADYTELQTFTETASSEDNVVTHEVPYVVSAVKGTVITFDMVITSQKEFPQVKRTTVTVN
ncbi:MAG TPA: hypothetical protein VIN08_24200 [Ohtaekwangia sp.]|uniref:hypothetical protein n=1 Tax=Ohtaekwangia sp. TaxID=2066019 RepID=UPI002F92F6DB